MQVCLPDEITWFVAREFLFPPMQLDRRIVWVVSPLHHLLVPLSPYSSPTHSPHLASACCGILLGER